jgi:hypothetical protein
MTMGLHCTSIEIVKEKHTSTGAKENLQFNNIGKRREIKWGSFYASNNKSAFKAWFTVEESSSTIQIMQETYEFCVRNFQPPWWCLLFNKGNHTSSPEATHSLKKGVSGFPTSSFQALSKFTTTRINKNTELLATMITRLNEQTSEVVLEENVKYCSEMECM